MSYSHIDIKVNPVCIMGSPSLKDICEKELLLAPAEHRILMAAARNFLTEWGLDVGSMYRDEQGAYDSNTLHEIAFQFLVFGLYSSHVKISPGKDLWTSSNKAPDKREHEYPRDWEL